MIHAAEKVLEENQVRRRNEWFDKKCEKEIESKNHARNNWIKTELEEDLERYREKKKEANRCCKKEKEKWINEIMKEIEMNSRDKKLFESIKRNLCGRK